MTDGFACVVLSGLQKIFPLLGKKTDKKRVAHQSCGQDLEAKDCKGLLGQSPLLGCRKAALAESLSLLLVVVAAAVADAFAAVCVA